MKRQAPRGQKREKELTDRFGCDFDELAVWDLDGKPLNEQAKHFDATRAKEGKKKEGGRMKLIARRGKSVYLVEIDEETGFVADLALEVKYDPFNTQAILARGYWEGIEDDQTLVKRLAALPGRGDA